MCPRGPAGVRLVVGFTSMDTVEKCARCAWRPGAAGGRGSLGPETKLDTERERGECAGMPRKRASRRPTGAEAHFLKGRRPLAIDQLAIVRVVLLAGQSTLLLVYALPFEEQLRKRDSVLIDFFTVKPHPR